MWHGLFRACKKCRSRYGHWGGELCQKDTVVSYGSVRKGVSCIPHRSTFTAYQKIFETDNYPYLGVTLDRNLNLLGQLKKTDMKNIIKDQIISETTRECQPGHC